MLHHFVRRTGAKLRLLRVQILTHHRAGAEFVQRVFHRHAGIAERNGMELAKNAHGRQVVTSAADPVSLCHTVKAEVIHREGGFIDRRVNRHQLLVDDLGVRNFVSLRLQRRQLRKHEGDARISVAHTQIKLAHPRDKTEAFSHRVGNR